MKVISNSKSFDWLFKLAQQGELFDNSYGLDDFEEDFNDGKFRDNPELMLQKAKSAGLEMQEVEFANGTVVFIYDLGGKRYVIDDSCDYQQEAYDWVFGLGDMELWDLIQPSDHSEGFWENVRVGFEVYHATDCDDVRSILRDGLEVRTESRAISNRGVSGIYTSLEPDEMGSYGDCIVVIDVGQMKSDGYMPSADLEVGIDEGKLREGVAWKIGLVDFYDESYSSEGISEDTIVFGDNIPAKYVKLWRSPYGDSGELPEEESDEDYQ